MKNYALRALLVSCIVMISASVCAANSLFLREKLKEKLVCDPLCGEVQSGTFNGVSILNLNDTFISLLDASTTFTLKVGDFEFEQSLGQDPNYFPGATRATLQNVVLTPTGTMIVVRLKLNWSSGDLRIKIKGITPFAASPLAADLVGSSSGFKNVDAVIEVQLSTSGDSMGYATHSGEFLGLLTRKSIEVNNTTYDLDKVYLAGGYGN